LDLLGSFFFIASFLLLFPEIVGVGDAGSGTVQRLAFAAIESQKQTVF